MQWYEQSNFKLQLYRCFKVNSSKTLPYNLACKMTALLSPKWKDWVVFTYKSYSTGTADLKKEWRDGRGDFRKNEYIGTT